MTKKLQTAIEQIVLFDHTPKFIPNYEYLLMQIANHRTKDQSEFEDLANPQQYKLTIQVYLEEI